MQAYLIFREFVTCNTLQQLRKMAYINKNIFYKQGRADEGYVKLILLT